MPAQVLKTVHDTERLDALHVTISRDENADRDFDALTQIARRVFNAPIALVSLVDEDIQWFRSCVGLDEKETEVSASFCAHAISEETLDVLVVLDATKDDRFAENRLVVGEPNIRFYAGHPVIAGGQKVGTLCVIDNKPRKQVTEQELATLAHLAGLASSLFDLKFAQTQRLKTERKLGELELLKRLSRDSAKISNWVWHPAAGILECDVLMRQQLGMDGSHSLILEDLLAKAKPAYSGRIRDYLEGSGLKDGQYDMEFETCDTDRWFKMSGRRTIEHDGKGAPIVMGVLVEITDWKDSRENKKTLLKELNHRVKNTLSILQSLSSQSVRGAANGEEYNSIFFGRLQAISRVHDMLSDNEWRGVSLQKLLKAQTESMASENAEIDIDVPKVLLNADQALGLGIIFHELQSQATANAVEDSSARQITIKAGIEGSEEKRLELLWKQADRPSGGKPSANEIEHPTDTLPLVTRGLDKVLGSKISLNRKLEGLEVSISFPI